MPHLEKLKVHFALLAAVLLWSCSFVAIHIGLESYSPGSLGLLRFLVASVCLAACLPRQDRQIRLSRPHILLLFGIGSIGLAAYSIFLNTGEKTVTTGLASFVVAQTPIITAALAILILKERPKLFSLMGILVSIFGVTLIWRAHPGQLDFNLGLVFISAATLCGSLQNIWQKKLLGGFSPYQVTALSTWFAAMALLIFLPDLVRQLPEATFESTMAGIFLGIVPSCLGQLLWTYGLSKTMAIKASTYLYAMPIFSTYLGWFILGEIPQAIALVGGSIALLGAFMVKRL